MENIKNNSNLSRWLAMYIRSIVAVLDFNANVNRAQKVVNGKPVYKLKVNETKL